MSAPSLPVLPVAAQQPAEDERTLQKNGNQTKPKQVPGTPWWVITNTNTGRKCSMIEHIMQSMQFPVELIEKVCGTISY